MKKFSKILSVALLVALVLSLGITNAFAATQSVAADPADDDNATITIKNPAKGQTYSLHKLFDATVGSDGTISYQCTGDIPTALSAFFTKDSSNNVIPDDSILVKDDDGKVTGSKMTDALKAALETWAATAAVTATAVSDGKEDLAFTGLPYGYYVVTTDHQDQVAQKALITVDSTNPSASIYDKNVNKPSAKKEVEKETYSIGDTITYTAVFDTTNYIAEDGENGESSKQVIEYVISDTLPPYLTSVTVTSFKIGGTDYKVNGNYPQFNSDKQIIIPWATENDGTPKTWTNIYAQGVKIEMEYTAVLTSVTNINAKDKNTISIRPSVDEDGTKQPWDEEWHDEAEIITYAAAIHKTDEEGNDLKGAQFTVAGLSVEPVNDPTTNQPIPGVYRVVSYDATSTTASSTMDTDDNGNLYILGLASDVTLKVTEFKAPDGYNKLTETKDLKAQVLEKAVWYASGERHFDADGNLLSETATSGTARTVTKNLDELKVDNLLTIQNNKGVQLPSTGGIGTTIFYVVGGVLVLAAIILLVTKKRMSE